MARYVDGFVIPFPKKNLAAFKALCKAGARAWRKHGALDFYECIGDDLHVSGMTPFPKMAKARPGELVAFSFIVYKSKAHRDQVVKKATADKKFAAAIANGLPFDKKRMACGGFKVLVQG